MDYSFHTLDDLVKIIREINKKYYTQSVSNIVELEEHRNKNAISYMEALRDAYSHLVIIFDIEDINNRDNKEKIKKQLERYSDHLERLLFDTYGVLISNKCTDLWKLIDEKEIILAKNQIASELKRLRIVDPSLTNDNRIIGYEDLLKFMDSVYKKFVK